MSASMEAFIVVSELHTLYFALAQCNKQTESGCEFELTLCIQDPPYPITYYVLRINCIVHASLNN